MGARQRVSIPDNRELLSWCAAIFEGEGTAGLNNYGSPILTISMQDADVIQHWARAFGLRMAVGHPTTKGTPMWRVGIGSVEGYLAIMAALWPWLFSRRRQQLAGFWLQHLRYVEERNAA